MHTKSAFVAIVGRPNVGKSSLLNRIVGEKVAIVTAKPQTTRTRITGVYTQDETQLVFIDTPGMHRPRTRLSEYMVGQIRQSVADVEVAVLVTEPIGGITPDEQALLETLEKRRIPALLALNKLDTVQKKELLLEKMAAFSAAFRFEALVPISAATGEGVDVLLKHVLSFAQPGPHFFDAQAYTDQPERVIAAELIREKLLLTMRDEVPHGVAVDIERMRERPGRELMDIEATIYCEKQSHKGMIIGKNGTALRKIATMARADLEEFLGVQVNLQCWVKVKDDWRNRDGSIQEFGFR